MVIPQNKIKQVIGNNTLKRISADSDGDGVMNAIDCQPYNPKKQGFIHNLKEKISNTKKEMAEKREQERQLRSQAKEKADEAYFEERKKVLEQKAVVQAKARARGETGFGAFIKNVGGNINKQNNRSRYVKPISKSKVSKKKVRKVKVRKVKAYKSKPKKRYVTKSKPKKRYVTKSKPKKRYVATKQPSRSQSLSRMLGV